MTVDLDGLMDFAASTARKAGDITLAHFGSVSVERKSDGSEVTAADHASEEFIRAAIAEAFPGDGILGEEGAVADSTTGRRWIVDPIDATRSFASGVPLYGVLIALEVDGRPILGCCHLPALSETLVAARGAGAWHNGQRAQVSNVERLAEARVVTSGLEYWRDWAAPAGHAGWSRLIGATRFTRTWGDCYGYVLVATGRADLMADAATGAYWDYAPMLPIIEEAGGRFTTLTGAPVRGWTTALVSNGKLHDQAARCWEGLDEAALQTETMLVRQRG